MFLKIAELRPNRFYLSRAIKIETNTFHRFNNYHFFLQIVFTIVN